MLNRAGQPPVLIVGGGIGGLAAALALAQKGVRTQVIEQAPEFKEVGAGIQLGPNVFRMFDVLGLTEAVSRLAVFPESLIMLDAITGEEVTRVPLDGRFPHQVHPSLCADLPARPAVGPAGGVPQQRSHRAAHVAEGRGGR